MDHSEGGSSRGRAFRDTGTLSWAGPDVDFARIRAISFAYPQGQDWRTIDAFDPPAIAAE